MKLRGPRARSIILEAIHLCPDLGGWLNQALATLGYLGSIGRCVALACSSWDVSASISSPTHCPFTREHLLAWAQKFDGDSSSILIFVPRLPPDSTQFRMMHIRTQPSSPDRPRSPILVKSKCTVKAPQSSPAISQRQWQQEVKEAPTPHPRPKAPVSVALPGRGVRPRAGGESQSAPAQSRPVGG